ncbi:FUSC family protein [Salinimicrobium oceani]|uniref:FUSC family protein n=1 Tax=Salinimicrobium oceani TaxID=2722702 RepID=A0ABX1CY68_9FLAO|nr:FUSC family membrane protein [Salinimicrobium oceani]NJW53209.1 FUSC family protein [Salinimicrobium oceani]
MLFQQIRSFFQLLKTAEFSRGIRFAVAAILPLVVANYLGQMNAGIAMAVGVLLTSPSEVPGSLRRRVIGVALSVIIAVLATLIIGYASSYTFLFLPVFILLIFHFSMISVYGFRASLISFSGLLAIVLSLAQVASEGGVITHALWIGAGGLWYLLFSLVLHYLFRRRETDHLLAEAFELTAKYLEIRAQLMSQKGEKAEEFHKELFALQTSINEKHELIREMVISRRKNFGRSGMVRKRLLIFMELVDILELGMANPVTSERMKKLLKNYEAEVKQVEAWSNLMADRLRIIAEVLRRDRRYKKDTRLQLKKAEIWKNFELLESKVSHLEENDLLLVYRNLISFKDKQFQKVRSIERLITEWQGKSETGMKRQDAVRFLTTTEYDLKTLQDHLDLQSPIFRHSLRLTVAMITGFVIGEFFAVQNAYWILLTTLVIMRPGYALTRDRFKQRLFGTLIGGAVAVTIVIFIKSAVVYGVLAVITLVLAHSMIQRNYKTAAAFITLNVVFIYSLLRPDVLEVIEFRVLDTIIGAGIAFLAAKFLWPTWEYATINNFIKESIQANREFLKEVELLYSNETEMASYRLARKKAFLAMGDLNAAFQRMAQEPKTHKQHLEETFRIVSLNQELLSATASLGTFIRSHPTTEATVHFRNYMAAIQQHLSFSSSEDKVAVKDSKDDISAAEKYYRQLYQQLLEVEHGKEKKDPVRERLQEVQVVMDRLKWLEEISESLRKFFLSKA